VSSPDGNGITLYGGSLRILDGVVRSGFGSFAAAGYAVLASGTNPQVRVTSRASLAASGTPPIAGVAAVTAPMPGATGTSAAPGGAITATVTTEYGDVVVLVVGLPGLPGNVPGFLDAFWLDPVVHVFHTIGVQQPGTPVSGAIAVPNTPVFLGTRLNWQAACFGPVTGTQATNPVAALVR
jgi:hypothetical protein